MPSATKRGQIFEEIFAITEYTGSKGWRNIGQISGGTQDLGDFYHNASGLITQMKSTNSTISAYKKVIDKLLDVKQKGIFVTKNGEELMLYPKDMI